ncbi:M20/M25/M40 family metallo-hydrolase [Panacibacter ginsenosidivorans]|uniref:Carboxypeptidase Q n=1 Tax=Panacibacter ginsenosidivorans TaxID=1813871 RepID=A0A5B8V6V6_9BACT|nr:M20/M25/M40 family metallo-hydrolase [Panacibacter ginsenosidivorans]QEC67217.1 M20/M25/M40 family metallo-hydrolase [Panacibacter ginsenosidivorans]
MRKLLIVLMAFPFSVMAQTKYEGSLSDSAFIKMISDNILVSRSSYDNLYNLTKKVGGRLAGSPQMVMAEQWGKKAMETAGADKVIMQECMVPHWVRGGKDKAAIMYNAAGKKQTYQLNTLALGNSLGTGAKGVEAQIIRVNNFDELEQKKDQLKGKIVFYNVPFEETFVQTFRAYGKNVIYRAIGASRAAKYGAAAVLVRSMTHAMDNNPHTGSLRYNDSFPKIPAAAIGLKDVAKLDSLLDNNIAVTAQLFTYGKQLPDTIGHSVIGELTGSQFPNEIITVGGHLDSWDVNEGATDDGAGVVQTIEILRAFKALGYQPKHTIRFVLFANEENGTRGGNKYAEDAKANNLKMIFALESDAGGFTPRGFGFTANDTVWNKIYAWKNLFEPYGSDKFTRGGDGTDIEPLNETFNTPVAGLSPDTQRYFDVHHAASDVFEAVNIRELKLGAVSMAALLYLVDKYGL